MTTTDANENVFFQEVSGFLFDSKTFYIKERATDKWKTCCSSDFGKSAVFKMWAGSVKNRQTRN
jgi:hypothetical protein